VATKSTAQWSEEESPCANGMILHCRYRLDSRDQEVCPMLKQAADLIWPIHIKG